MSIAYLQNSAIQAREQGPVSSGDAFAAGWRAASVDPARPADGDLEAAFDFVA